MLGLSPAEWTAVELSLRIAIVATVCALPFGIALGWLLARKNFWGKALVDGKGMTLYVFDRDTTGASNCNGVCATNWPPFKAAADVKGPAPWTVVTRGDGGKQWAYKGKPVYTFSKDAKPGDVKGDGVNAVWHVAAP